MGIHGKIRRAGRAIRNLTGKGYSYLLTRKVNCLSEGAGICAPAFTPRVRILKASDAQINLRGRLLIEPWQEGRTPILISCGSGSKLTIDGDFQIGGGTQIILSRGAELYIGGRRNESASGITECSKIMVRRRVWIGVDFICAWNVFITDCDWHEIVGQPCQQDTVIGDHVWVASGASILKGTTIGDGAIVACGSVAHRITIPPNSLAGGVPCRILAEGRNWRRDMPLGSRTHLESSFPQI